MLEDKKIEIMNIQYNSLTQCTVEFLHYVIQVILKLLCLKLGPYSFIHFFIITKRSLTGPISVSESFCSPFCRWQFLLELCNWHFLKQLCRCQRLLQLCSFWGSIAIMLVVLSATFILVDLFVAVMQVTVSVEIIHLEVYAPVMQVKTTLYSCL